MQCPSCEQRKARRACPALSRTICTVCCATKRLDEIKCPSDCGYLASARVHPAAVVRRQQERDVAMLLPSIRHLTERQHQLFFLFHSVIARHTPEGFGRVQDADVAEAAGALAATLETAQRGLIYEHGAQSPIAQGLVRAMTALVEEIRAQGTKIYDGEGAIALRAIEQGARETARATSGLTGEADPRAYLAVVGRLLGGRAGGPASPAPQDEPGGESGSIIIP